MPESNQETLTFRSPGVAGDLALMVVLLPLAAVTLTLLSLFPVILVDRLLGAEIEFPTALRWAVALAIASMLLLARVKLFWSITLEPRALRLGRFWPRRVPYERILYLEAGRESDVVDRIRHLPQATVPLVFATGWLRQQRIFLRSADARQCLRELYGRCPNATALDLDGEILPPRNGTLRPYHELRLARTLAIRSAIAVLGGVTTLVGLVALIYARAPTPRRFTDLRYYIQAWGYLAILLPITPALFAYGLATFRRMLRVLRGDLATPTSNR
jgi:hypothetical protein